MDLGLKGKVAMVAGASRGLGFAVARALVDEGAIGSSPRAARPRSRSRRPGWASGRSARRPTSSPPTRYSTGQA